MKKLLEQIETTQRLKDAITDFIRSGCVLPDLEESKLAELLGHVSLLETRQGIKFTQLSD